MTAPLDIAGMRELLPCPFCGAKDERLWQSFVGATDTFAFWSVECLDCGVEVADDSSQEAANRHWNTRPPDRASELEREVAALREALTPSECTKYAYSAEVKIRVPSVDEDGYERFETRLLDWTAIKDVMALIRDRAALRSKGRR